MIKILNTVFFISTPYLDLNAL